MNHRRAIKKEPAMTFRSSYIFIETQEEAEQLKWLVEFMRTLPPCWDSLARFYKELVEKMDSNCSERNVTQSGTA